MDATLSQQALFELRHIVIASGADALWVYRDPRVIGRKLLTALLDAGYIVASREDGYYRPTAAGMEAAR